MSALDTVLITGAGPVGFGAIVNALFRRSRVILVESQPWRVERARQMGVSHIFSPTDADTPQQISALTDGKGVDVALDCSGSVAAQRLCLDATRRRGTVLFIGECAQDLALRASPDLIRKGLTLQGAWHYNRGDYHRILQVIQHSPLLNLLVSHVLP